MARTRRSRRSDQIACRVSFKEAATGINRTREITLRNLDLQATDVLLLIRDDNHQAMSRSWTIGSPASRC